MHLDNRQNETGRPRAILIQHAYGAFKPLLRLTDVRHRAYCERHGIVYKAFYGDVWLPNNRHPYWYRVQCIRAALSEGYERVIWLDADCLIADLATDLCDACPDSGGIGLTWHEADWIAAGLPECYDHYNCGAIYVRDSPETRTFVEQWWQIPDGGHCWHEQHVLNHLVDDIPGVVRRIDGRFNSIVPDYVVPNPAVMAWHGYGTPDFRLGLMREALETLETQESHEEARGLVKPPARALTYEQFVAAVRDIPRASTTRHAQLLYGLVRWLCPQTVVEVGTFRGFTAAWLARALQENESGRLVCMDDFSLDGADYAALRYNLERCGVADVAEVRVGKSGEIAWPESVDLAYIDGDHSLAGCMADVHAALSHGARCVVLHDTTAWWGPRKFIEHQLAPGDVNCIEVAFDEGLAVIMRPPDKPPLTYTQEQYPSGSIESGQSPQPPAEWFMSQSASVEMPAAPQASAGDASLMFARANALQRAGNAAAAVPLYEAVLKQDRQEPEALRYCASALATLKRYDDAIDLLRESLAYEPNNADAWRQLSAAYLYAGEHDEAGKAGVRAVMLAPDSPTARWNYSLCLLREGNWGQGFRDYRWGVISGQRPRRALKAEWDGEPMSGKTLFLWAEQGLGDTLMCARFIQTAKAVSGARVIVEVQPGLVPLLCDCPYADMVFAQTSDQSVPESFDAHCSLMSLPRVLEVMPDDLSGQPYIYERPAPLTGVGMKVGLCRSGNRAHINDWQRSLSVADIRPIADVESDGGLTLYSLHPEAGNGLNSWVDTAQRIAAMDLVIACDTAVAHLAGAMGVPCWLLLPKASDWRWLTETHYGGTKTPWYKTMTLYRQTKCGDWRPVIERVCRDLREMAHRREAAEQSGTKALQTLQTGEDKMLRMETAEVKA